MQTTWFQIQPFKNTSKIIQSPYNINYLPQISATSRWWRTETIRLRMLARDANVTCSFSTYIPLNSIYCILIGSLLTNDCDYISIVQSRIVTYRATDQSKRRKYCYFQIQVDKKVHRCLLKQRYSVYLSPSAVQVYNANFCFYEHVLLVINNFCCLPTRSNGFDSQVLDGCAEFACLLWFTPTVQKHVTWLIGDINMHCRVQMNREGCGRKGTRQTKDVPSWRCEPRSLERKKFMYITDYCNNTHM